MNWAEWDQPLPTLGPLVENEYGYWEVDQLQEPPC